MKTAYRTAAVAMMGLHLLMSPGVYAEGEKVSEEAAREVVEGEKQAPEEEKRETGEASGNIKDCEQVNESDKAGDAVEEKDIDDCDALVK